MILHYDIAKCREVLNDLHNRVSEFATTDSFFEEYELAMYEYFEERDVFVDEGENPDEFFRDDEEFERFMAWYSFYFVTDSHRRTFPSLYRRIFRHQVSPFEEEILKSYDRSVLSLYEVQYVDPGKGFEMKNLFNDRIWRVQDAHYSRTLCKWDILYGGVVSGRGSCFLGGFEVMTVPPRLKDRLSKDVQSMYEAEKDEYSSLDDFLRIRSAAVSARVEMALEDGSQEPSRNSDGDLLCPTILHYRITDSNAFAERIRESPLFSGKSSGPARNPSLSEETYTWIRKARKGLKVYDTPPLGILTTKGNRLQAESNSRERAKRLRTVLDSVFGAQLQYRSTTYEDPDWRVPLRYDLQTEEKEGNDGGGYDRWLDGEVPVLDGLTPREAAMTPDGRERLIELMKEMENENERILRLGPKDGCQIVFPLERIKKELGL